MSKATGEVLMARYPLNLPVRLKQDAERWARQQGASLNQFIVWAVAEKVGELKQDLGDPRFPHVAYRVGASRWPTVVVRGTGIRVQTLAVAAKTWGMSVAEISDEYDLKIVQVEEALAFYQAHRDEIDQSIEAEQELEAASA